MNADLNRLLWQERAAGDTTRAWESLATEPVGLREEADAAGLWLRPPGADDETVLLAIHGGGFVSGSIGTHRRLFGHLALASGMTTLVVDYGLVPEHVYPAQIDQVREIYRGLAGRRAAVAGDSCGGTLALEIALRETGPEGLVLFSPWVDFSCAGASYDAGTDPFFTRELGPGWPGPIWAGPTRRGCGSTGCRRHTCRPAGTRLCSTTPGCWPRVRPRSSSSPSSAAEQTKALRPDPDSRLEGLGAVREPGFGTHVAVPHRHQRDAVRTAARRQLDAYLTAFRTADITGLTAMLRADARLELIPGRRWFDGVASCLPVFAGALGEPGDWRMEPVILNGQPGARVHFRDEPMGVAVLDCRTDGIAAVTVFADPRLVH